MSSKKRYPRGQREQARRELASSYFKPAIFPMTLNSIVSMTLLKLPLSVILATAFIAGLISFVFAHSLVTEEEVDRLLEQKFGGK